jgi:UDP-glucose 4-epimerase|tara:strand:+ start:651 stop:1580 length:930 start_codon:yes stop_codon:yes gene_type:complete
MKILVTGGSGFIGSHIVEQLAKEKNNEIFIFDIIKPDIEHSPNVRYVDGDICYKTSIDKVIKNCEEVYDCAGVLGTHELVFQTERAIDTNIKGAFNVIQSCLDYNVKRVFHPTKPIFKSNWENTYTISKITAENFVRMFKEVYKMDVTILRWMNASGPRQHIYPVRKFIPIVICQAILNEDIEIYGTGNQTVDIIDVRDIANIAIKSVRNDLGKENIIYDVGSGNAISCNDVAKFIVEKLNSKSKIRYIPMRIGEAIDTKIVAKSHSELLKKLNIKLEYSMEKTLEDCINYMKSLDTKEILRAYNFFKN